MPSRSWRESAEITSIAMRRESAIATSVLPDAVGPTSATTCRGTNGMVDSDVMDREYAPRLASTLPRGGDGLADRNERGGVEGRPTHQRTIDVRLRSEALDVLCVHRAAVLDAAGVSARDVEALTQDRAHDR